MPDMFLTARVILVSCLSATCVGRGSAQAPTAPTAPVNATVLCPQQQWDREWPAHRRFVRVVGTMVGWYTLGIGQHRRDGEFSLQQDMLYGGTVGAVLGWGAGSAVAWVIGRLARPDQPDPPTCRVPSDTTNRNGAPLDGFSEVVVHRT
jgi:hypothetical protein